MPSRPWPGMLISFAVLFAFNAPCPAGDDDRVDFNRDVRPILSERCFACHGRDEGERQSGLRLDLRDWATGEAESGLRAIVPGDPDDSELIVRVTADEGERMPPEDGGTRLTEDEIDILIRWIEEGAEYTEHWSFVAPARPRLPEIIDRSWPRNGIDYFLVDRLERESLSPSPMADRATLIRRLSLDLLGLPPSPSQVRAFVEDTSDDAYERLVDQTLAQPAFGERWARVWLDLARYADSRGFGSDPLRNNAWRYRDWVIDALNRNNDYRQFTLDQLAGDLQQNPTLDQLIATAFHRNTMTNVEGGTDDEEFRVAAVKDRVDTTMQVWMGLTAGCAKCHNHKYDPISQVEYYELYAFFNQTADTDKPNEFPTIEAPSDLDVDRQSRHARRMASAERELIAARAAREADREKHPPTPVSGRFVRVELPGSGKILSLAEVQVIVGDENKASSGTATQSSVAYDGPPGLAIDGNTNGEFNVKSTTHTATEANPWWELDLGATAAVEQIVVWNRTDGQVASRLKGYRVSLLDEQRQVVWSESPGRFPAPQQALDVADFGPAARRVAELEQRLAEIKQDAPPVPTLPIMRELPDDQRRPTHLLVRGNFLEPGQPVEPAVPVSFHDWPTAAPENRLGIARWLMADDNPLTARVAVNRLWSNLFGRGLVMTEEDFGTQGEAPSHPELLDWLACELVDSGWDIKHSLRLMVMSATYRQSSRLTTELRERDPANLLLARAPRYRLDAETVRDQALALAGLLSTKMHGPSVYPYQPPGMWRAAFNGERTWPVSQGENKFRRGLYTFWRRTVPYPSMATFDAPSRELCTVRRIRTNTPLQALVGLNDPVFVEASQALARRMIRQGGRTARDRSQFGLQLCLARPPETVEIQTLVGLFESELEYYRDHPDDAKQLATDPLGPPPDKVELPELAAWTVVANVLLNLDGVLTRN